jgi:hypothetical protein
VNRDSFHRVALSAVLLGLTMPAAAQEAPIPTALCTAEKHASLAAGARGLADVRSHLHHVLNCLEGPKGPTYDPKLSDPCGSKGALDELPAGSGNRVHAQKAIELARVGVTFHDFKPAHYTAQAVRAVLEEASADARKDGAGRETR